MIMEAQYINGQVMFYDNRQYHQMPVYVQSYEMAQKVQESPFLQPIDTSSDMYFMPSTPPLSTSGSTMNSPPSHSVLPTPVSAGVFDFGFEGKPDLHVEHLSADWTTFASPPLTPIYGAPQLLGQVSVVSPADLSVSCPSLSPSPSPLSRSVVSAEDSDFCDPRNLVAEPSVLETGPTLCSGDDDEHKFLISEPLSLQMSPEVKTGFTFSPNLSLLSELDSEDELFTSFTGSDNVCYLGAKRQRTEDDFSGSEELFGEYDPLAAAMPLTPSSVDSPPPAKKARKQSRKATKKDEELDESAGAIAASTSQPADSTSADASAPGNSASQQQSSQPSSSSMSSSSDSRPSAPVVRRGRKQSLTEDPSKTFVCDLCNRRFRRQEHLKRHYRSLHTHDKPFSCGECGKKFSRSDNLSQHARTHGAGTVVMGVLEDGELPAGENGRKISEVEQLGAVLFEAAQAAANSSSSSAGSSPAAVDKTRKRKREE